MQPVNVNPLKCCGVPLAAGKTRCPKCKMYVFPRTIKSEENTVLLANANAIKANTRARILTNFVDEIFGGGVYPTSVSLLGGEPGSGKTTLALQLCETFLDQDNREVLYIANEQSPLELYETAYRLGIRHTNRIRVVKAMGGFQFGFGQIMREFKPCLTILDSITKWSSEDLRLAVFICEKMKEYVTEIDSPAILINQVIKGGEHAGLNQLQHAADMTAIFDIVLDDSEPLRSNSLRRLWTLKNRFGVAPIEQFFEMTKSGLVGVQLES